MGGSLLLKLATAPVVQFMAAVHHQWRPGRSAGVFESVSRIDAFYFFLFFINWQLFCIKCKYKKKSQTVEAQPESNAI